MRGENKVVKRINQSLWISVLAAIIAVAMGVWIIEKLPLEGGVIIGTAFLFLLISAVYTEFLGKTAANAFREEGPRQNQVTQGLINEFPIPYLLADDQGNVMSYNPAFQKHFRKKLNKRKITQMFPEIYDKILPARGAVKTYQIVCDDIRFRVDTRCIVADTEAKGNSEEQKSGDDEGYYVAYYFTDVTRLMEYEEAYRKRSLAAGLVYIDNIEEVLEGMEEVRQSLLLALVERKIIKYLQEVNAICKKFERDKFIFVLEQQQLQKLKKSRFSLLDEVRAINIGNSLSMTLSIGVGVNEETYPEVYESARIAMDLALGRGGDQAVVRNRDNLSYYGGKTQKVEKSTRVKARVKAHALRELMLSHDRVLIMGHKGPDADCLGAALGIYNMAQSLDREAYLVVDAGYPAIEPIVTRLMKEKKEGEQIFVSNEEALQLPNSSTMLVVVDVNIPSMTECPELFPKVRTTVVLDHHRQKSENIRNATFSYVEPYASSTCEMVTEVLQYVSDKPRLKPVEADALYAGIMVDTDNFVIRAGVRTFEATAYLRRAGADVGRVRKMFREDFDNIKILSSIINQAEVFMDEFVISSQYGRNLPAATVIGAKAANSLLDINGIRASFVLTALDDYVHISARSIDDVNVQIIMEKFGGGGHMTVAAAQVKGESIPELTLHLKKILAAMRENGEI